MISVLFYDRMEVFIHIDLTKNQYALFILDGNGVSFSGLSVGRLFWIPLLLDVHVSESLLEWHNHVHYSGRKIKQNARRQRISWLKNHRNLYTRSMYFNIKVHIKSSHLTWTTQLLHLWSTLSFSHTHKSHIYVIHKVSQKHIRWPRDEIYVLYKKDSLVKVEGIRNMFTISWKKCNVFWW